MDDTEKQMKLETLGYELDKLKKLHIDLEKQMINFEEIVPFELQRTTEIYSPRLVNMMLVCGAQIDAVVRLIARRCSFTHTDKIPPLISSINKKAVLPNFPIVSILHNLQFTPFTRDIEFWNAYNQLKHKLEQKQFEITYTIVMDAFAALAALHCLADKIVLVSDGNVEQVLEPKNWINPEIFVYRDITYQPKPWKSLLFRIDRICNI